MEIAGCCRWSWRRRLLVIAAENLFGHEYREIFPTSGSSKMFVPATHFFALEDRPGSCSTYNNR